MSESKAVKTIKDKKKLKEVKKEVEKKIKKQEEEKIIEQIKKEDEENEIHEDTDDEEDEDTEMMKVKMLKNLKYDFASYEIKYIYETYLKNEGEINLSPSYQREFAWSNDKQDLFIDSIINNYIIPPIILIKLNDKKEYRYECMDGQHRLTVLKHFIEGKSINPNDPHYIRYNKNENNKKMNIFYEKKKRLENIKDSRYMTEDEKSTFNDKKIIIIKISNYDPRLTELFSYIKNEMFLRLQKGEKVCGTDILRNCSHSVITNLKKLNLINYKTYLQDEDENGNYYYKIKDLITVKTKKPAQLLTEYLFFILRGLLIIKNKSIDIGNLSEVKMREDILQTKTDRFNLKENETWDEYMNTFNSFIKEVSDEFEENDKQQSQYLLLILLYYYITDKTTFTKILTNINNYSKFNDEYFKKHFTVSLDGKPTKVYTGKRLLLVLNTINTIKNM